MFNSVLDRKPSFVALACSLLAVGALSLLAGQAIAQAKAPACKTTTTTQGHGKRCTQAETHSKAKHATKRKAHGKTKPKPAKKRSHVKGTKGTAVATCEDGSKPVPANEESYVCEDGSEPACPQGFELKTATDTGALSCTAVAGSASETATCDDGSEATEAATNSFTCDDGSEPACLDGSEPEASASGSTLVCGRSESNDDTAESDS